MPKARKHLVSVSDTPYYHVTSRCVRRAFLCGTDRFSGRSYEHRRQWIEDRIRILASLFAIEICAYAVMSNHYHVVVRLIPDESDTWTDDDVLERWTSLYQGPLLVQRYRAGEQLCDSELEAVQVSTAVFRQRLQSLSWFMKCLNEPIARAANKEDRCTGHFWEARFHSQALRSKRALVTAMAYVDLNPIRAGLANTPEQSKHTSIKTRLVGDTNAQLAAAVKRTIEAGELYCLEHPVRALMPFADSVSQRSASATLPMREIEYFKLVDITGRVTADGNRGRIDPGLPPLLEQLGLSAEGWIAASTNFKRHYRRGDLRKIA